MAGPHHESPRRHPRTPRAPGTPGTPGTPGAQARGKAQASELRDLRKSLTGSSAFKLAADTSGLADNAFKWGSASFCNSLLGGRDRLLNCPDGMHLLAALIYPVRNSMVTSEVARAASNLAFYARGKDSEQALLDSGLIPELLKALQWTAASGDEDVAQCCCMALADLCLDSPDGRREAAASGAAVALKLVSQAFDDPDVLKEANRAMTVLACDSLGRKELIRAAGPQALLLSSITLHGGEVMKKRSERIYDCRQHQALGAQGGADYCPRASPAQSPARGTEYMRKSGVALPGAGEEMLRLRWHRGKRDSRNIAVADCTYLMPCQAAVRKSCIAMGDRKLLAVQPPALQYLGSFNYAEIRQAPAKGNSLFLCVLFAWLERLLGHPLEPLDGAVGEEFAAGRIVQAREYKSAIERLWRDACQLDMTLLPLAEMGYQNLIALVDSLCDEQNPFTSNELLDVLSGSMRFTLCIVCFLKVSVAATIQREPEVASWCLGRTVTLSRREILDICERDIEPLGLEPVATLAVVLNALACNLQVEIVLRGYPQRADSLWYPVEASRGVQVSANSAHLHLGYQFRTTASFFLLYEKCQPTECPHFEGVRAWASQRSRQLPKHRQKNVSHQYSYPPKPSEDRAAAAALEATEPARPRTAPQPQRSRTVNPDQTMQAVGSFTFDSPAAKQAGRPDAAPPGTVRRNLFSGDTLRSS